MNAYLIEERGLFWWTENAIENNIAPDGGICGSLTVDNNGTIKLELDHVMSSTENVLDGLGLEQISTTRSISGILKTSNQYIILSNLWRNGGQYKSHGLSYDEYGAWTCLVSRSPINRIGAVPKFRNMTIPLDGFEVWMGFGNIDIEPARNYVKVGYKKQVTAQPACS